jgi:hypothetical protein
MHIQELDYVVLSSIAYIKIENSIKKVYYLHFEYQCLSPDKSKQLHEEYINILKLMQHY